MGRDCSMHGYHEECMQNFSRKPRREDTRHLGLGGKRAYV
jgi:hypothetical protein